MTEQEKSLKLSELMGWRLYENEGKFFTHDMGCLCPYNELPRGSGRAQFAAILLRFPEVMARFVGVKNEYEITMLPWNEPTQANILDEILRMNGVDV